MALKESQDTQNRILQPGEMEPSPTGRTTKTRTDELGEQALKDARILVLICWLGIISLAMSMGKYNL